MNEETVVRMADLLRRRKTQRECLATQLANRAKVDASIQTHVDEINKINKIQRALAEWGYTGQ